MSYFIIIRGPLGSGKSTIATQLARRLKAEHVHMDEVLSKYGLDKMPPGALCIPAKNFIKANKIILPEVKRALASGKIVIFDACFYHQEVIENIVQNLPYEHYIFTLKAPIKLCIKRDSKRSRSYGAGAAEAVHALVSRFDYGININVAGTLEDTLTLILKCLPKSV